MSKDHQSRKIVSLMVSNQIDVEDVKNKHKALSNYDEHVFGDALREK